MLYYIYTTIKNIVIYLSIANIILSIEYKLNIINNNNSQFINIVYFLGGVLLAWELFNRIMFPKVEVNVTIENEKIEK